jgi:hypothetical protein
LKNYDSLINNCPGKANLVADALTRKVVLGSASPLFTAPKDMLLDLDRVGIELVRGELQAYLNNGTLEPTLLE